MLTLKDSLSESILFWGGNGNSLQYSNRDNPMDRGAWQTTVRGVSKSQTQLSNWAHQESILYREQTYGHGERGGEGEMYGESNTETYIQFSSVQFSPSVMSDSLRAHELQHARPPCPSPTPGVHSNSCPSSRWCHPASHSLSSPSPPAPNPSQHQSLFQWVNSLHEVAKVLEFQL